MLSRAKNHNRGVAITGFYKVVMFSVNVLLIYSDLRRLQQQGDEVWMTRFQSHFRHVQLHLMNAADCCQHTQTFTSTSNVSVLGLRCRSPACCDCIVTISTANTANICTAKVKKTHKQSCIYLKLITINSMQTVNNHLSQTHNI